MANYDVNTDLVLGDDIFLYLTTGQTVLAFATSCSIQVDGETIDTSNKMSGRWNSNLAGKNSYTINADALYTKTSGEYSYDNLMSAMIAGSAIDWYVGSASGSTFTLDTTDTYYSGEGLITSLSLNAGNNEVANCSVTITGSGAITKNG